MKMNSIIGTTINDDRSVTFNVKDAGAFTFHIGQVSAVCADRATLHGFIQRISDGAAMSRDQTTGLPATPEATFARMKSIAEHYMSGTDDWGMKAAAGVRKAKGFDVGAVVMALVRAGLANDVDGANALIDGIATKRGVDRTAAAKVWAGAKEVAQAIADAVAEKAPSGAEALLAEMGEAPF